MKRMIVLLLVGSILLFTGCVENSTVSNKENETTKVGKTVATFKMNEDAFITNEDGKFRIRFTSVKETSERNQFSDKRADRVIIVEYEYENLTREDDLYISSMNFKMYDKDNNALETYPSTEVKYADSISLGRKTTASEAYALNNNQNYIELEFYDNMFNSKADAKFILEW